MDNESLFQEPSFRHGLDLNCLRISDTEDWDAEINSLSTAGTSWSEHLYEHNKVIKNPVSQSTTSTVCLSDVEPSVLHPEYALPNKSSSDQKECFGNEKYFGPTRNNCNYHLQNHQQNYIYDNINCSPISNAFRSHRQVIANKYVGNSSYSDHCQTNDSIIQSSKVPSKRPFVKDCLSNFHVSIPHDIPTEASSQQAFEYENMFQWDFMEKLTQLEAVFGQKDEPQFLKLLKETLISSPPYTFLLYLIENHVSNMLEGKKSLAHVALMQFNEWRDRGSFAEFSPTEMEKDRALWIITTRKLYLFDLCNKVFKFNSKGNEYLQRHIYYLLQTKKRYKEVEFLFLLCIFCV